MEEQKFTCSECGVPVIIVDGEIIRPCEHKEAAVLAHCSAHATGEGGVEN